MRNFAQMPAIESEKDRVKLESVILAALLIAS